MKNVCIFYLLLVALPSMSMQQDSPDKIEQLLDGIKTHNLRTVCALLQEGINVDCTAKDDRRPIDTLFEYSRENIANDDVIFVKTLAAAKELNYLSWNGNTPLYNAVYYANDSAVKFLLKAGADVNAQNEKGQTVLMAFAKKTTTRRCVDMDLLTQLFAAGVKIDIQDNENKTVLDYPMHESLKSLLLAKQLAAEQHIKRIETFNELKADTTSFVHLLPPDLMSTVKKYIDK